MTQQNTLTAKIGSQSKTSRGNRHSMSFYLTVYLIVYMVLYFYLKAVMTGERVEAYQAYLSLLANVILFVVCYYKLFIADMLVYGKFKLLFILFLILVFISYFVNFSGLEKLIGLCDILMLIMLFQKSPLNNKERNFLFYLFSLSLFIILLNGSPLDDGQDSKKFNSNGCAFILSMLFCVSIVRFTKAKTWINLLFALISFALQFIFVSRTAMFSCLVFLFLFVIFKTYRKTYKFKTIFYTILMVSVFGVLFAYIYAEVLFPLWGHGKIIIFGKDLFTGRQEIWHYTFESIQENPIWGVGSHLNDDLLNSGFYDLIINAHNQPLGLLAAFGLLPFIVFYVTFAYATAYKHKFKKSDLYFTNTPALFILLISLMSWFDLYFFSQYNWVPILIAYCLICGYSTREKKQ